MGAFDKVSFHGRLMDEKCRDFLLEMEKELGYELTIMQGNYNPGGVSQSGGTHDGGGTIDLAAYDYKRKVECAADLGAFAWYRRYLPGVWGAHIHLGIRSHGRLSPNAVRQQVDWDAKPPRDGLRNHYVMNTKTDYHPGKKITFEWPVKVVRPVVVPTNVSKARDELVFAIQNLGDAAALLDDASPARVRAKKALDAIKAQRVELKATLRGMPKR